MRRTPFAYLVLGSSLVIAAAALAQEEEAPPSDDGEETPPAEAPDEGFGGDNNGGDNGADTGTPLTADDITAEGGETPASAPESYTVQRGDTLWNLSQRFLNNPWYWPKIWSYNPQLDNPNWIRPGTVLRFYPGQEPVVEARPEEDEGDEEQFQDLEGGGFQGGNVKEILASRMTTAGGRRREFFIPSERIDDQGQILNSPEEMQFLSTADRTYVKLKKGGPGDKVQIFRKERELRHPVTGAVVGQLVTEVGELRIDQTGKEQALGTVTAAWDVIERGQYVDELPVRRDRVEPVPNQKNVKGYVVDAAPASLSFVGESYLVVVDKGSADGVEVGNTFTIVRAGDPYTREYSGLTDEDIGEVLIIETFKNSSTGLLTAASREIVPGDRVEMRVR